MNANMIRLRHALDQAGPIAGETFWAKRIAINRAVVDNVPFFSSLNYGDEVYFDPTRNEVVGVRRRAKEGRISIKFAEETTPTGAQQQVINFLKVLGCKMERATSHFVVGTVTAEGLAAVHALLMTDEAVEAWNLDRRPAPSRS